VAKMLAGLYESSGRNEEALTVYRQAHDNAPDDSELSLALVKRYLKSGKDDEAAEILTGLLEKQPDHVEARLLEAEHLKINKDYDASQQKLDQLLVDVPGSFTDANYQKALTYLAANDATSAIDVLTTVIEQRPDHMASMQLLSKIYISQRQYQSSLDLGEQLLSREPDNVQALGLVGASAILLNQLDKARGSFEKLTKLQPNEQKAYQGLGLIYTKLNNHPKAITAFEKVLSLVPGSVDTIQKLIAIHLADGHPELAYKLCDQTLEANKGNAKLTAAMQLLKGQVYLSQKDLDKAEASFEQAIKTSPDLQEAYYMLAALNIKRYGEERAITEMQKRIDANPEQPVAHLLIANMYDMRGQHQESEPHYRKVILEIVSCLAYQDTIARL
jgi:tetratricopeptide (TPR) repeat protein